MARQVSRPKRSASASGPSAWPIPSFITVSTASGVATPSITQKTASLIIGMSTRFDTKPGESLTSTGVLPRARAISSVRRVVASAVSRPRITSTSCITGTGFMKCIPITCAGRSVAAASPVIEMEEVLEARMAPGGAVRSSSRNSASLILEFSLAASTTNSASFTASSEVLVRMRPSVSAPCSLLPAPFLIRRSIFAWIVLSARESASGATSTSAVSHPAWAKTWAIPLPIVPAPTTATRLTPPQTKRAPSYARANRSHGALQQQHGDGYLPEVAQEKRQGAELHAPPQVSGDEEQLGEAAQVDQRQAGEHAQHELPPPPARGVAREPAHGERSEGGGEEGAARPPEQPPQTRDPERREHREARRAAAEIEGHARRPA